jgi:hypothetical protein
MSQRCTTSRETLAVLFAALANRGITVVAYYEREHTIGLVLATGHVVETERRRAFAEPHRLADCLAAYLPRRAPASDYDPLKVPEISPRTAEWWMFLRWCQRERKLEVRQ